MPRDRDQKQPVLTELAALPNDALLTEAEAACVLRIKPGTLRNYRGTGGGPKYRRIGPKRLTYRKGDLLKWADERCFAHTSAEGDSFWYGRRKRLAAA